MQIELAIIITLIITLLLIAVHCENKQCECPICRLLKYSNIVKCEDENSNDDISENDGLTYNNCNDSRRNIISYTDKKRCNVDVDLSTGQPCFQDPAYEEGMDLMKSLPFELKQYVPGPGHTLIQLQYSPDCPPTNHMRYIFTNCKNEIESNPYLYANIHIIATPVSSGCTLVNLKGKPLPRLVKYNVDPSKSNIYDASMTYGSVMDWITKQSI